MPDGQRTDTSDMAAVHRALLGAFDAAPELVRGEATAERAAVVASFYDNVLEFLHVHHDGEDVILYPLLEQRCPHERGGLEEIDAQHRLLDEPMAAARLAVDAYRRDPGSDGALALTSAILAVDKVLRPHLADEEALVVPLAAEHLTPEEWGQLPGHSLAGFQKDKPWLALGLVLEQLDDDQRAQLHESLPPPVRQRWDEEWSAQFLAFVGEVRGG